MSTQCNCAICNLQFKSITNTHLKSHGMTLIEYKEQFPNSLIVDPNVSAKLSANTKKQNSTRDYSEIGKKISASKKQNQKPAWNKGIPMHQDQKDKLSKIQTGNKYRLGIKTSEESKSKISDALKKFFNTSDKVRARTLRKLELAKKIELADKIRFDQYNSNIINNDLELISIDYKQRSVLIRCKKCGLEFYRTKQSVEESKANKTKCRACYPPTRTSKGQLEILEFIKSLGIEAYSEDRSVLHGKEIDIYAPDFKIGFEYNGLYWHSELNYGEPKHLLWKQQFAHNEGVRLIHIFEDEWLNKAEIVKSRIKNLLNLQSKKIYARKCKVQRISSVIKNEFLDENHLQGRDVSKIAYGLYHEGELVSVMTFKPGSFIKGHRAGWELNRFCSKLNLSVVGGASRLFSAFIKEFNPTEIISFADKRWNTGDLYANLGFKFSHLSAPSYWYLEKYAKRYHRGKFMKHTLVNSDEDKAKTEWQIMQDRGYDRIWDCGTVVYSWKAVRE